MVRVMTCDDYDEVYDVTDEAEEIQQEDNQQ
jgi:hypothetical protein